mmetsp:Transcript_53431/g.168158  ORF Transcript_53431/g.168158 Transcript_53431/m.168158 type:complete len:202 (+) Transcript_53431:258-863(+)
MRQPCSPRPQAVCPGCARSASASTASVCGTARGRARQSARPPRADLPERRSSAKGAAAALEARLQRAVGALAAGIILFVCPTCSIRAVALATGSAPRAALVGAVAARRHCPWRRRIGRVSVWPVAVAGRVHASVRRAHAHGRHAPPRVAARRASWAASAGPAAAAAATAAPGARPAATGRLRLRVRGAGAAASAIPLAIFV